MTYRVSQGSLRIGSPGCELVNVLYRMAGQGWESQARNRTDWSCLLEPRVVVVQTIVGNVARMVIARVLKQVDERVEEGSQVLQEVQGALLDAEMAQSRFGRVLMSQLRRAD